MGSSYMERASILEKGRESAYMGKLMMIPTPKTNLDEEQYAIMSLICEKLGKELTDIELVMFVEAVEQAQALMPSGYIHSRQVLVTLAMFAGLTGE